MPALSGLSFAPLDLGRLQDVRAMQTSAFRVTSSIAYDEAEVSAIERCIYSIAYADRQRTHDVEMALVGSQIIGTAGWAEAGDDGETARLTDLFVDPLFMRLGIGSALAQRAEARARSAGYVACTVRASLPLTAFFTRLGYQVSAHGTFALHPGIEMAAVFLRKPLGPAAPSRTQYLMAGSAQPTTSQM